MTARYSRLATASTEAIEHVIDADYSVDDIKAALEDGLQAHDIPVILAACARIDESTQGIREQLKVVADVEMDIDIARRVLNVGREEVYDRRYQARERRLQEMNGNQNGKAPNQAYRSEANKAA